MSSSLFDQFSSSVARRSLGTDTLNSNSQFYLAIAGLSGALLALFFCCLVTALCIRRRKSPGGKVSEKEPTDEQFAVTTANPALVRDGSSASRQRGALSFDGREGWRSDAELRLSARGSRASSRGVV